MKQSTLLVFFWIFWTQLIGQVNPNSHYVKSYLRSDGAYVKGHIRTDQNNTNRDNYTTKPNVNPHTGKKGFIEPNNNFSPRTDNFNNTPSFPTTHTSINSLNSTVVNFPILDFSYTTPIYTNLDMKKEQERWEMEELPKLKAEQNRLFPSYNSILSKGKIDSRSPMSLAIKYHDKYSIEDRRIIEFSLQKLGFEIGTVDGYFDNNTIEGIMVFQIAFDITADGKMGPYTLKKLNQQFE